MSYPVTTPPGAYTWSDSDFDTPPGGERPKPVEPAFQGAIGKGVTFDKAQRIAINQEVKKFLKGDVCNLNMGGVSVQTDGNGVFIDFPKIKRANQVNPKHLKVYMVMDGDEDTKIATANDLIDKALKSQSRFHPMHVPMDVNQFLGTLNYGDTPDFDDLFETMNDIIPGTSDGGVPPFGIAHETNGYRITFPYVGGHGAVQPTLESAEKLQLFLFKLLHGTLPDEAGVRISGNETVHPVITPVLGHPELKYFIHVAGLELYFGTEASAKAALAVLGASRGASVAARRIGVLLSRLRL